MSRPRNLPGQPIQIGLLKNDGPFFKPFILGHELVPSDHPARPYHDFSSDAVERMALILLGVSGEAVVHASMGRERLLPGSVFMAALPCKAEILLRKNAPSWEFTYVLVRDAWPMRAFDWLREQYGNIVHLNPESTDSASFIAASKKLVALAQGEKALDLHTLSQATYAWFLLLVKVIEKGRVSVSFDRSGSEIKPSEIPRGCNTIKEMARQLGYSPAHLSRKLARTWKKAPGASLRYSRLEEAANLLRNTDLSVGEVATRCGYLSPSSFIRAFRLLFKQTPADWRHHPDHSMPEITSAATETTRRGRKRLRSPKVLPTTTSKPNRVRRSG
jgi:AraC-like DNA-binding protein